jgi:hypothetical protein
MPLQKYARSLEALALAFPLRFSFRCLGVTFEARASQEETACRLTIEADLGPVPFTAESPQARALRLALINVAIAGGRFIERQHNLYLVTETTLEADATARRLVAAAVAQVLRCRPELALAAETAAITARRAASRPQPVPAPRLPAAAEPEFQASAA